MKKINLLFVLSLLVFSIASPAFAQAPNPIMINGTIPIATEVRDALNAWLAVDAPFPAPYYAATYTQMSGSSTLVSLVALNLGSPDEEWTLESDDGQSVWIGTVRVTIDGEVLPFSVNTQARSIGRLALPDVAAGGGSYVSFPWQAGKGVIFGVRGIHGEGGYGTSGMFAVDFVSGTDLGASAASDRVYASDAGTVDYVCDDGTSVAIRTYNSTTGDYFIYAHMLDNASLVLDQDFSKSGQIGTLKHGSFDPPGSNCGWAEQQDNHWHLHWMFVPASGSFRAENCILTFSDEKWHCGSETIGTGQWLVGGGGVGTGVDDPGSLGTAGSGVVQGKSLWDYVIIGVAMIIDPFFKLVPEHQGLTFVQTLYNAAEVVIRLVVVFAYGNINLGPVLAIFFLAVAFNAAMGVLWVIAFALKAWKSLVPILGA